jgi:hypothetical protein
LRTVAHDFRRLALAHPNVVPLLVTRPLATPLGQRPPGMLRPLEDVVALLTSAGFSRVDALHIYRVLFGYLYGHILTELQEVVERLEETDDVLRLGLHRLAITEFPQVRALGSYDGAAELDRGLDLLLIGLTATLTPPHRGPRLGWFRDGHKIPGKFARRARRCAPRTSHSSGAIASGGDAGVARRAIARYALLQPHDPSRRTLIQLHHIGPRPHEITERLETQGLLAEQRVHPLHLSLYR